MTLSFNDLNKFTKNQSTQKTNSNFSSFSIPLTYFDPFKPVHFEVVLPQLDKQLDYDLDLDQNLKMVDPLADDFY